MMNFSKLTPDDPRLTAYALGELEGDERAAVEAALRDDPAARAVVEEIQGTAAQLTAALAEEAAADPATGTTGALQKAAMIQSNDYRKPDGGPLGKLIRFPQLYYVVGGLAAACFAVLVALRPPEPRHEAAAKTYQEVALAPAPMEAKQSEPMPTPVAIAESKDAVQPAPAVMANQSRKTHVLAITGAIRVVSGWEDPMSVATVLPAEHPINLDAAFMPKTIAGAGQDMRFGSVSGVPWRLPQRGKMPNVIEYAISGDMPIAGHLAMRPRLSSDSLRINFLNDSMDRWVERGGWWNVRALPLDSPAVPNGAFVAKSLGRAFMDVPAGPILAPGAGLPVLGAQITADNTPSKFVFSFSTDAYFKSSSATATRTGMEIQGAPPAAPAFSTNTEAYAYVRENDFLGVAENPRSTFSADVDTASYANVRRFVQGGRLPPADAVRVEELVNYFPYHYAPPAGDEPFAASMEVADAPWAPTHRLVRIGLKGREVATATRPAANLVFLIDVSGSMNEPNKLPLVKESMRLLLGQLRVDDRVAIVVYAGASGLALPSTPVAKSREILAALEALVASGTTNGAMGLQLAYDIAKANFVPGGVNRVILCTDGDFNVGVTSEGELTRLIQEKAKSGVSLTALGFGMGNYKDAMLKQLADQGNGNYGYIDTSREAKKLLVEQVNGTLMPIAKDVKLQVEFNPAQVASYRLIGYEDRLLKKEDFNDDAVGAGEIGAGHTVTALYEIVPVENPKPETRNTKSAAVLTLKVRYKEPAGTVSLKREFPLTDAGARFAAASADFKFTAAVAEFGMILRDSPHKGTGTLDQVVTWAEAGTDSDAGGYRTEFVELVRQAEVLMR